MFLDQEDSALLSRQPYSLEEVSADIAISARNNFSALLRKMAQFSLETIGDKLRLHKSNICRMKENGELARVAAITAAIGYDIVAMEEEIKELRRQNAALQIVAQANLSLHKEKPEVSCN